VQRWLDAALHPARRDGVIAAALLVLPWLLGWALALTITSMPLR
jgi:hypothetical protein